MLVFQQHFDLGVNPIGKNLTQCLLHQNALYLAFLVGFEMIRQTFTIKAFSKSIFGMKTTHMA